MLCCAASFFRECSQSSTLAAMDSYVISETLAAVEEAEQSTGLGLHPLLKTLHREGGHSAPGMRTSDSDKTTAGDTHTHTNVMADNEVTEDRRYILTLADNERKRDMADNEQGSLGKLGVDGEEGIWGFRTSTLYYKSGSGALVLPGSNAASACEKGEQGQQQTSEPLGDRGETDAVSPASPWYKTIEDDTGAQASAHGKFAHGAGIDGTFIDSGKLGEPIESGGWLHILFSVLGFKACLAMDVVEEIWERTASCRMPADVKSLILECLRPKLPELIQPPEYFKIVFDRNGEQLVAKVGRTTPLRETMDAYCSQQGLQSTQVRFMVDGERIAADKTAENLELKENAIISVYEVQIGGGGKGLAKGEADQQLMPPPRAPTRAMGLGQTVFDGWTRMAEWLVEVTQVFTTTGIKKLEKQ